MTPALLGLLFCALILLLLNTAVGHFPGLGTWVASNFLGMESEFLEFHIILGVLGVLLALFSVCLVMFYLIGTGKQIKENIQEENLDKNLYKPVKEGKRRFFPTLTLAMVMYVALPCVGAAVTVDYLNPGFHRLLAYLTVLTHGFVCYQALHYLKEQDRTIVKINRRLDSV